MEGVGILGMWEVVMAQEWVRKKEYGMLGLAAARELS